MNEKAIEAAQHAFADHDKCHLPSRATMRAAIAAYEQALWQPIEVFPYDDKSYIFASRTIGLWIDYKPDDPKDDTHFRPLPPTPKTGDE